MDKWINTQGIIAPEFIEVKYQRHGMMSSMPHSPLGTFITAYQSVVAEFYRHQDKHGDLLQAPWCEEDEYEAGTDEQREQWRHAGRQRALWFKLSCFNGELLRRVQSGKRYAMEIMQMMMQSVAENIESDGCVPRDAEEENIEAEQYPHKRDRETVRRMTEEEKGRAPPGYGQDPEDEPYPDQEEAVQSRKLPGGGYRDKEE